MRIAIFTVLAMATSSYAFLPPMPTGVARLTIKAAAPLVVLRSGEYSEKVRAIVLENSGDDPKVADYLKSNSDDAAEFSELGFDSLDLVEFSMAIQKEFDLPDLSEDDLATFKTLKDVVALVESNKK
uniref:Plastid acyl carrier protein n=1 Tax=Monodopsis sp. MarTras21 TaxID=1745953 RepID=A0A3R5U8H9_9STRA|nr:plastid acyl carrier protein [Monodopsis sp. MarTras21]